MILRKLFSGKQVGTLYHYTSILACRGILKTNFLKGFTVENPAHLSIYEAGLDIPKNIHGIVSFTRDKNFHRVVRALINTQVRFVVDGDKLSNNYKIVPFDYFSNAVSSIWDTPKSEQPNFKKHLNSFLNEMDISDEQEEVLLLRKGQEGITGFLDYVMRLDYRAGPNMTPSQIQSFKDMVSTWADIEIGEYV